MSRTTIFTAVNVAAKIRQEANIKATNSAEEHIQPAETSLAVIRITNVIDEKFDRHFPVA